MLASRLEMISREECDGDDFNLFFKLGDGPCVPATPELFRVEENGTIWFINPGLLEGPSQECNGGNDDE